MKAILAPVDFSDVSNAVVDTAANMAKAWKADLYLLHVAPPDPAFVGYEVGPQVVRDAIAQKLHEEHRQLQEIDRRLERQGIKVTSLLCQGETVAKILQEAERLHADMVVIGSHGHGALHNLLVGSVTEGVLRHSVAPVLVVPGQRSSRA